MTRFEYAEMLLSLASLSKKEHIRKNAKDMLETLRKAKKKKELENASPM